MHTLFPEKIVQWRTFAAKGPQLAVAFSGLLATLLAGCEAEPAAGASAPAIVLSDVTLRHYGKDGDERIGTATEVTFSRDTGHLEALALTADVPPTADMARGGTHLEAGRGAADIKGQTARLEGGVVVTTGDGDVGRTEAASWEQKTDTITGESPVEVAGPGYEMSADSFSFRVHDHRLELGRGVRVHSQPVEAGE